MGDYCTRYCPSIVLVQERYASVWKALRALLCVEVYDSLELNVSAFFPSDMSALLDLFRFSYNAVNMTPFDRSAVTHQWIFATSDSPIDTSCDIFFEAEITNVRHPLRIR